MYVARVFVSRPNPCFLRQILVITPWSLNAHLQMAWFLIWIYCLGTYSWAPSRPVVVGGGCVAQISGRSGFEWVSLRRCARNNLGARYLLRQSQSWTWLPVQLLGMKGNWKPISAEHPGVWTREWYLYPDVNLKLNVKNGFIHFSGHE